MTEPVNVLHDPLDEKKTIIAWSFEQILGIVSVDSWVSRWITIIMRTGFFKAVTGLIAIFTLCTLSCEIMDRREDRLFRAWNIVYTSAGLGGDGMKDALEYLNAQGKRLDHINLQGAVLDGINLENAHLAYANLQGCSLRKANLRGADLKNARFDSQENEQGNTPTDLSGADLSSANLQKTRFLDSILVGANLDKTDLRGSYLLSGKIHDGTTWAISIKEANMYDIQNISSNYFNDSAHFREWALKQGAVEIENGDGWEKYIDETDATS